MADFVAHSGEARDDGQEPDPAEQRRTLHSDHAGGRDHEHRGRHRQDERKRHGRAAHRAVEQKLQRADLHGRVGERVIPVGRQERPPVLEEEVRVAADVESVVQRSDRRGRDRNRPREYVAGQPELSCETPPHTELIGMRDAFV